MHKKRLKFFALLGILGGLSLSACGEKKEDAEAPAGGGEEKGASVKAPEVAVPEPAPVAQGDLSAVAKATGFAQYMPNTTHAYVSIYDGKGFLEEIRKSKLVKLLEQQAAEQGGVDLDELKEQPEANQILSLLAEEIFVGVGDGAPAQLANLVSINESTTRHWIKFMVKMGEGQLTGRGANLDGPQAIMPVLAAFLGDELAGMDALERAEVPPVTLGFKVSDDEVRGQVLEMAAGGLQQLLEQIGPDGEDVAESVEIERGDSKFTGIKLIGKKVAAKIGAEQKEAMAEVLDAAAIEKLIKILETKNVVIAVGAHGNYLVGFAGSAEEQLKLAATPGDSVLGRAEMNFMKSYADKKLLMLMSASKELQDSVAKETTLLGSLALGLKEGLGETEGFGDTQDLEVLLDLVAKEERALFDMYTYTPAGVVVFLEKGLKAEAYGGSNMADLDLDTPRKYAGVGMADDIFLFANWVENPAYTEKALEYLDSIGQTIYLGAKHVATMKLPEGADLGEFAEQFGMFDEQIRPHLLDLWVALRKDLVEGLGAEGAVIVDLKGQVPTVPGLPQLIVDKGKAPRLGILAPADDPEKLKSSWERIDTSLQALLKVASEITGNNIPMQKPMSSEKNDLKTWFFPFPFQTDDFVLSISVDKKNFFASTSKSFVQGLSAQLETAEVDESQKGAYFNVNLTLLNAYLNDWLKLVEENADEIFGVDSPNAENFKNQLPILREVIGALGELKGIKGHIRKAEGTIRASWHFETGE